MTTKSIMVASMAFAAALLALSGTATAGTIANGALTLSNLTVSPNPAVAGGNVTISFKLYNSYDDWLYSTDIQVKGAYPLFNVSPVSSNNIGVVNPGLDGNYLNYTFQLPATLPSGTYTIDFVATYHVLGPTGSEVDTSTMSANIYVQNKPAIKVVASGPSPGALYSGYNQTVTLSIENTGYGNARNVTVSLTPQSGVTILSSVPTFFISNLTQGTTVDESLLLSARNVSTAMLSAGITYYSSDLKQRFYSVQGLSLSVAPAAQFGIGSLASAVSPGSTDVPIHFRITNTGTSEADQLQLSLQSTYPITPVSSSAFVGSLAPGESTNVTFLVSADSAGVPGNYPITIYEQWHQPNGAVNQQFSASDNYFVTVSSGNTSIVVYAAVVVVIVGILLVYNRKKIAARMARRRHGKK